MKKNAPDIFDAAQGVGDTAPLQTKQAEAKTDKKTTLDRWGVATRTKAIRHMPVSYFDQHEALFKAGETRLDFSAFIVEAVREKLEAMKNK